MSLLDYLKADGAEVISEPVQVQKALAYIRVSHEDSAGRGTSLETQRRDIERYASREGIQIVEWFEEPGKSAFKNSDKRTEFARMVGRAKEEGSNVSLVLVWKSDRFSRDRYQAAAIKGELAKAGVRVLSVLEPYDARTTSGIVLESVTDAMNQIRSMEIGQVTHRNLLINCEMRDPATGWAYKNGGWAQFGYRNHRIYTDTHRKYQTLTHCIWVLDDEVVAGKPIHEWARTMLIEWRLGEKLGADAIAQRLTSAGVPTPSGRSAWSDTTVDSLLVLERLLQYSGYGTWNKNEYRHGGKRPKDRSEWKIIEKAHPPIITPDEAEAIHAIRLDRRPRPGRRTDGPSPYVLSGGLPRCTHCGANYAGRTRHEDEYYLCGSHIYRHGADCTQPWYIRRKELDAAVFECVEQFLVSDPRHLRRVVSSHNKWVDAQLAQYQTTEDECRAEIGLLEREIENLMQSVANGIDPAMVRASINDRTARLNRMKGMTCKDLPRKITAKELQGQATQVLQIAKSRDTDRKRIAVRQFVAALEADPERHVVRVLMHPPSVLLCPLDGSARGS